MSSHYMLIHRAITENGGSHGRIRYYADEQRVRVDVNAAAMTDQQRREMFIAIADADRAQDWYTQVMFANA